MTCFSDGFANAIYVTAFWFNFISLIVYKQSEVCASTPPNVRWWKFYHGILFGMFWFDLIFFFVCVTSQFSECMEHWLRLIERKLNIIPLYMEWSWCSTWIIIIFAVCLWQNTWLHESNEYWTHTNQLRLTQTQTYAHEFTQCNWNVRVYTVHVHKSLDDDLHQKWSEHKTIFE